MGPILKGGRLIPGLPLAHPQLSLIQSGRADLGQPSALLVQGQGRFQGQIPALQLGQDRLQPGIGGLIGRRRVRIGG